MKPPRNILRSAPFELRSSAEESDGFTLEGYAAVFGSETRIDSWEGLFDEVIERGAFKKSISERMPVMQFDHGKDAATGSVPIGSIEEIREDDHGLYVRGRLHDNERVKPIRQAIASRAIDGMSFRFRVHDDIWDHSKKVPLRTLRQVEVPELGPVVFAAYTATSVGVRSMLAGLDEEERCRLISTLRDEYVSQAALLGTSEREQNADAAQTGTSADEQNPDAAQKGTSGMTVGEREAFFRSLLIRKVA